MAFQHGHQTQHHHHPTTMNTQVIRQTTTTIGSTGTSTSRRLLVFLLLNSNQLLFPSVAHTTTTSTTSTTSSRNGITGSRSTKLLLQSSMEQEHHQQHHHRFFSFWKRLDPLRTQPEEATAAVVAADATLLPVVPTTIANSRIQRKRNRSTAAITSTTTETDYLSNIFIAVQNTTTIGCIHNFVILLLKQTLVQPVKVRVQGGTIHLYPNTVTLHFTPEYTLHHFNER